jgi:hypothetical protein
MLYATMSLPSRSTKPGCGSSSSIRLGSTEKPTNDTRRPADGVGGFVCDSYNVKSATNDFLWTNIVELPRTCRWMPTWNRPSASFNFLMCGSTPMRNLGAGLGARPFSPERLCLLYDLNCRSCDEGREKRKPRDQVQCRNHRSCDQPLARSARM